MKMICAGILLAAAAMYTALYGGAQMTDELETFLIAQNEPAETIRTESVDGYDAAVSVKVLVGDDVLELSLQDYLTDVVMQEMPASFDEEALKAQAVAARTFTLRSMYAGGRHEGADLCGDSACCQCYLDATEGKALYGDSYEASRSKVMAAVKATDGQVMVYENELIEAVYFSSTGGSTEAAAAVWGGEVPYLQPVSSFEDLRVSVAEFTPGEVQSILPEALLSGDPLCWFGKIVYTEGGAVSTMEIGTQTYDGTVLRRRFGLKSARFTVDVQPDKISFEVVGSGHGVGMSQYGANAMAAAGESYQAILRHYYTGAELKSVY